MSDFRKPRADDPILPRSAIYREEPAKGFKRPKGRRGRKPKGKKLVSRREAEAKARKLGKQFKKVHTEAARNKARDEEEYKRVQADRDREQARKDKDDRLEIEDRRYAAGVITAAQSRRAEQGFRQATLALQRLQLQQPQPRQPDITIGQPDITIAPAAITIYPPAPAPAGADPIAEESPPPRRRGIQEYRGSAAEEQEARDRVYQGIVGGAREQERLNAAFREELRGDARRVAQETIGEAVRQFQIPQGRGAALEVEDIERIQELGSVRERERQAAERELERERELRRAEVEALQTQGEAEARGAEARLEEQTDIAARETFIREQDARQARLAIAQEQERTRGVERARHDLETHNAALTAQRSAVERENAARRESLLQAGANAERQEEIIDRIADQYITTIQGRTTAEQRSNPAFQEKLDEFVRQVVDTHTFPTAPEDIPEGEEIFYPHLFLRGQSQRTPEADPRQRIPTTPRPTPFQPPQEPSPRPVSPSARARRSSRQPPPSPPTKVRRERREKEKKREESLEVEPAPTPEGSREVERSLELEPEPEGSREVERSLELEPEPEVSLEVEAPPPLSAYGTFQETGYTGPPPSVAPKKKKRLIQDEELGEGNWKDITDKIGEGGISSAATMKFGNVKQKEKEGKTRSYVRGRSKKDFGWAAGIIDEREEGGSNKAGRQLYEGAAERTLTTDRKGLVSGFGKNIDQEDIDDIPHSLTILKDLEDRELTGKKMKTHPKKAGTYKLRRHGVKGSTSSNLSRFNFYHDESTGDDFNQPDFQLDLHNETLANRLEDLVKQGKIRFDSVAEEEEEPQAVAEEQAGGFTVGGAAEAVGGAAVAAGAVAGNAGLGLARGAGDALWEATPSPPSPRQVGRAVVGAGIGAAKAVGGAVASGVSTAARAVMGGEEEAGQQTGGTLLPRGEGRGSFSTEQTTPAYPSDPQAAAGRQPYRLELTPRGLREEEAAIEEGREARLREVVKEVAKVKGTTEADAAAILYKGLGGGE